MRSATSSPTTPTRALLAALAAATALVAMPRPAEALSGLYTMVGVGYGKFGGSELILEESAQGNDLPLIGDGCCAKGGVAAQLRLGYSFFGFAAEVGILGNGWDLGSDAGGGGLVGGGLRFYPLDILDLAGMETADFPLDFSLGGMFGYAMVGKNFAYTGTGVGFDFTIEYKLAEFMNLGLKLDIATPSFGDFVYTDYKNDTGRCLDFAAQQITTGPNFGRVAKDDPNRTPCDGKGPSTTLLSPQLVFTFYFDLLK
ncbi:hypothetical protein L6R52_20450 [Myxococcota bacterium]|nr:hypothetical protein [Myxococcota bacterium]